MRSKKLLLQHHQQQQQPQQQQQRLDPTPLQYEKETEDNKGEKKMLQDLEQEIECPRCYDIMSLSSNFDSLCYFCQECNLSLLIN
jgi:hypothetical protein